MTVSIGRILGDTMRSAANDALFALLIIAALTAAAVLGDVYAPNALPLFNIATVVLHFYVLRRLVHRQGLASAERLGGFGGFFGLGILTGLAMMVGTLALVLPGLFLAARWGMADIVLIAEDSSATAAMSKSWQETEGHSVAVMVSLALIVLPGALGMLGLIATGYFAIPITEPDGAGLDALFNLLLYLSQVLVWYFEVALYALLVGSPSNPLGEVFA